MRALLALLAIPLGGCVHTIPHEPNRTLIHEIGPERASREISELLTRAVEPPIGRVEATDDFFDYQLRYSTGGNRVHFTNISRHELYENGYVYFYGPGDVFLAKFLFAQLPDSRRFLDLVLGMRARRERMLQGPQR